MYRLKTGIPDFEVVDGKFAGRKYQRGKLYAEVPPEESKKFERVDEPKQKTGTEIGTGTGTAAQKTDAKTQPPAPDPKEGGKK
jgi:hypothetical protein